MKSNRLFVVLALALGVTTAHAQGLAWVSSEKDNSLTLVDLKTLAVTGTVPTCKRPRHIQRTPDGKQLLVACGESHAADIIDLASRKSVGKLALGDDPEAFDLSPDGKTLYASNEDEGALSFIDLASGKVTKSVEVGKEPEGVKVSPDGKTVWVTSEAASLVHVIDVATAKVTKNIKVGKRPRRFALTPDGKQLWVTNELGASVTVLSTQDYSVLGTINFEVKGARAADITPVGITMTRDGKRAFVALGRANHVAFVDVAARKVTDLVLVGKRAWNVALDKAETRLVVVNGLSDDITVVDVPSAKALKSIAVGRVPYMALVIE
jgi:PQQ-dependent catabolism-associated beta-propeller protein